MEPMQQDQDFEAIARRRILEMSLSDLLDTWAEVMPAQMREQLLGEFRSRGYRISSLPARPTADESPRLYSITSRTATDGATELKQAERAIRQGAIAGFVSAAVTMIVVSIALASESNGAFSYLGDAWNYLDVALIIALSIGVWRKSRTAAIGLAAYFVAAKTVMWFETGETRILVLSLLFLILFLRAAQGTIAYTRIRRAEDPSYGRPVRTVRILRIVGRSIGVAVLGLVILSEFMVPAGVVAGEDLGRGQLHLLRDEGLLEEGEQVVLFYSAGLFSIREDGNIVTDRRVISYGTTDDEVWVASARYEEILSVGVQEEGEALYHTIILVTPTKHEAFYLWAPSEDGGDELFLQEIRSRMSSTR